MRAIKRWNTSEAWNNFRYNIYCSWKGERSLKTILHISRLNLYIYIYISGPATGYIVGVPRRNKKEALRWSSWKLASSMKKGGQLEQLALQSTVPFISGKVEEQRKLSWRSHAQIEPLQYSFLLFQSLALHRLTFWSQLPWFHCCIDHVLLA